MQFITKLTNDNCAKRLTWIQKPTPAVAVIDILDEEERGILVDDNEIILAEEEIGNLFQGTSSEEESLQLNLQALQDESSSLKEPDDILQIHICDQKDANFPGKITGIDVTALYDMGT